MLGDLGLQCLDLLFLLGAILIEFAQPPVELGILLVEVGNRLDKPDLVTLQASEIAIQRLDLSFLSKFLP